MQQNRIKFAARRGLRVALAAAVALVLAAGTLILPSNAADASVFAGYASKSAALEDWIAAAVDSAKAHNGLSSGDSLLGSEAFCAGASSTDTDWMAMAMARFSRADGTPCLDDGDGYARYLAAMRDFLTQTYAEKNGLLHRVKATEWHRAALTVAALGGDETACGEWNGAPIDLLADGVYQCDRLSAGPGGQGINGWLWGLLALDAHLTPVPADARFTRADYITQILAHQTADGADGRPFGGWSLGGVTADPDLTAMALQALAPYYNDETVYTYEDAAGQTVARTVRQSVDDAIAKSQALQNADGGFTSWGSGNIESVAQVVTALCSLGIDPATDPRFVTPAGKTPLDALLQYRLADGGFRHVASGGWNAMATDQATYALVACWRLENGMRALYDMRPAPTAEVQSAVAAAKEAIATLPAPTDPTYRAALREALTRCRAVPESERRYIYHYATLAAAIEQVGGEDALTGTTPFAVSLAVTVLPTKTDYTAGETFDPAGMELTATFSDGSRRVLTDGWQFAPADALQERDTVITLTYGALQTTLSVTVRPAPAADDLSIGTAAELEAFAARVNGGESFAGRTVRLTAPIDLGEIEDWIPAGRTQTCAFAGVFDGQGYAIENLHSTTGGLFGYVANAAVLRNIRLRSGEIRAAYESFVGGIAGWSDGADFVNCSNGADLFDGNYVGGIVGTVRFGGDSVISGCYNTGAITTGGGNIGGIVGHLGTGYGADAPRVTIENCYSTGAITADYFVGGIVGRAQDGHTLRNCYQVGAIASSSDSVEVGGVLGLCTKGVTVETCYFSSDGCKTGIGFTRGDDTTVGQATAAFFTDDFRAALGSAFRADRYGFENGGYPLLYWQTTQTADAVDDVIAKIAAIGVVTRESAPAIQVAREAYDALPEAARAAVENYETLEAAEATFAALPPEETGEEGETPPEKDETNSGASGSENLNQSQNQNQTDSADAQIPAMGEKLPVGGLVLLGASLVLLALCRRGLRTR